MMPRSLRSPVRLLLFLTAGAVLLALLAPAAASRSPYVSALADLAASPVYAKGCSDRICNRNVRCVPGAGYSCNKIGTSGCEATPCV